MHSCVNASLLLFSVIVGGRHSTAAAFALLNPKSRVQIWLLKKASPSSFFSLRGRLLPPGLCRSLASRQMSPRPLPEPRWSSADGATLLTRATSLRIWRQLLSPGTSSLHKMQKMLETSWSCFCRDERCHWTLADWFQLNISFFIDKDRLIKVRAYGYFVILRSNETMQTKSRRTSQGSHNNHIYNGEQLCWMRHALLKQHRAYSIGGTSSRYIFGAKFT